MNKRIYCCGVFDMLHEGHLALFENASKYGNLVVGVLNDTVVESYKRKPIMTMKERANFVKLMKHVVEVVEDCPLYTTREFMEQHNIDIVAIGEEYFFSPYQYYEDCVADNKYCVLPRYNQISTSDIIQRIKNRNDL